MKQGDLIFWRTSWDTQDKLGLIVENCTGRWGEKYYKILLADGSIMIENHGSSYIKTCNLT